MSPATLLPEDHSRNPASSILYQASEDRRDESLSTEGAVVAEWSEVFESIQRHGVQGLNDWRNAAARISRERGLAYRPASVEGGVEDGWTLDPVPWVISRERWQGYEQGIAQRIRLFSHLLKDIYGDQRIFSERIVPAEIVLGHKGFLRALHDFPMGKGGGSLGLSAIDVARDSAGQAFVVNDRFDKPFGLGLALENRTVINKVLPRLFRRCRVKKIGQFFTEWFDFLQRTSPTDSERPLIVILDPSEQGDDSEISFLANYCDIARVHPSDLTVRDGRVWIKALSGLVPVDVIWKTMPGSDMDSLESEKRFSKGVAGIFEASRQEGGVSLVSHPGAEVLQSPGFYPYLQKLCRAFLGEDLLLPPVATWWCGSPTAMSHVISNLSSMVIKPVGSHHDLRTQYGRLLTAEQQDDLKARIKENPGDFVGQEELMISTIPVSRQSGLVPRSAVLRVFSFLDEHDKANVMPGGLARVSKLDRGIISTRESGESKDVWVRSLEEEEPYSIANELDRTRVFSPEIVPSRTAENLFWTGRYAERTDVISRFALRVLDIRNRGISTVDTFERDHENLLMKTLFDIFDCESLLENPNSDPDILNQVLRNRDCPAGIDFNLDRFYSASQAAREEWSPSSILAIGSCYQGWNQRSGPFDDGSRYDSGVESLQLSLAAFLGLNLDSMTRDEGWALLDSGRRIERATIICGLLRFLLDSDQLKAEMQSVLNESILYILDSVRTYQSRFHEKPAPELTTRLLLGEVDYPRSILHILTRLYEVLQKVPTPVGAIHPGETILPQIESLNSFILSMDRNSGSGVFDRQVAVLFIDQLLAFLASLSDNLTTAYFSHAVKKG